MNTQFDLSLGLMLGHEGGFSDHPKDPGGRTNYGVTEAVYHDYLRQTDQDVRAVERITKEEVADIYKGQYWDAVKADMLPPGVDYAVFDFAVNSGPAQAARSLQRVIGVEADGVIGVRTLAAVRAFPARTIINGLCDRRLAFMKKLRGWPTFGRGWSRRVSEVRSSATGMVAADDFDLIAHIAPDVVATVETVRAQAKGAKSAAAAAKETIASTAGGISIAGVVAAGIAEWTAIKSGLPEIETIAGPYVPYIIGGVFVLVAVQKFSAVFRQSPDA